MQKKEQTIFNKILENNNIKEKVIFVQHRNLKEFRSFEIERVNPTHHLILFGRLRHHLSKDKQYNKLLNVGEIFIYSAFLLFPFNNIVLFILNYYIL
jgi:hypothetical protein